MESIEDIAKLCKAWFEENNIDPPINARDWAKKRSGVGVPVGCTTDQLRSKGITPGKLLPLIRSDYTNRLSNKELDYDSLGLSYISREGTETIVYKCSCCGEIRRTLRGTLVRWQSRGDKYCNICRNTGVKDYEYYSKFLSEDFVPVSKEGNKILIKHTSCDKTFYRDRDYLNNTKLRYTKDLKCPHCSSGFVHGKYENYLSMIERDIIEYLISNFSELEIHREVLYKDLIESCDRNFRLDVWLPELSLGLEITTENNNLPNYRSNLDTKLSLAKEAGVNIVEVNSIQQVDDIVRYYLKG